MAELAFDARSANFQALVQALTRLESLTRHLQAGPFATWALTEIVECLLAADAAEVDSELADVVVLGLGYLDKVGKLQLALPAPGVIPASESASELRPVLVEAMFMTVRGDWRKAYKPLVNEQAYLALIRSAVAKLCITTSIFVEKVEKDKERPNRPFYSDSQGRIRIAE
jgi:hypothetical protein